MNPMNVLRLNKFLQECLRGEVNFPTIGNFKNTDWKMLIEIAQYNEVLPYLYRNFKKAGIENCIPNVIYTNLHNFYMKTLVKNMTLLVELERLIKILTENQIKCIVLKGPVFAIMLYENIGLRTFFDIDLLIKHSDIKNFLKVINNLNFFSVYPSNFNKLMIQRINSGKLEFIRNTRIPTIVNIHWGIPSFLNFDITASININDFWNDAEYYKMGSTDMLILSHYHQLIQMCLHLAIDHCFHKLKWLLDIHKFIERHARRINWIILMEMIKEYKVSQAIGYSLYLSSYVFKTKLTAEFRESLRYITDSYKKRWFEFIIASYNCLGKENTFGWGNRFKNLFLNMLNYYKKEYIEIQVKRLLFTYISHFMLIDRLRDKFKVFLSYLVPNKNSLYIGLLFLFPVLNKLKPNTVNYFWIYPFYLIIMVVFNILVLLHSLKYLLVVRLWKS